jgi:hypothetical protein
MGKKGLIYLGFGVLSFVFFICMNPTVHAQQGEEGMCVVPTDPGEEHPVPPDWNSKPGIIKIVASSDTINSTAPVTLNVASNGWGSLHIRGEYREQDILLILTQPKATLTRLF